MEVIYIYTSNYMYTLIFQLSVYLESGVDRNRYLIYWQMGAWFQIYRELEDQGIAIYS